jgi:hypothetical protein
MEATVHHSKQFLKRSPTRLLFLKRASRKELPKKRRGEGRSWMTTMPESGSAPSSAR